MAFFFVCVQTVVGEGGTKYGIPAISCYADGFR